MGHLEVGKPSNRIYYCLNNTQLKGIMAQFKEFWESHYDALNNAQSKQFEKAVIFGLLL